MLSGLAVAWLGFNLCPVTTCQPKHQGIETGKKRKKKHLPANSLDVCGYFLFFVIEGGRAQNSLVASRCFTCVCNMPDNVRFGLVIECKHRFGLTFM